MNSRGKPYSRDFTQNGCWTGDVRYYESFSTEINIVIDASVCLVIHVL